MRYIKQYDPKYRGHPWPIGVIVVITNKGRKRVRPVLTYYYVDDVEDRADGSFIYSICGCTKAGEALDNHGMAWLEHDEIKPLED